jgi:hypothetical protein
MHTSDRSVSHPCSEPVSPTSRTAAVRTRMPGGVGGAEPRGSPLSRSLALNVDFVMPASRSLSGAKRTSSKQADVANDPKRRALTPPGTAHSCRPRRFNAQLLPARLRDLAAVRIFSLPRAEFLVRVHRLLGGLYDHL